MSHPRVQVIILAEIVPEHEPYVRKVLHDIATMSRQEEGCLRFDIYRDDANPMKINTLEEWVDHAALDRHLGAPYMKTAILKLVGKLVAIPEFRVLQAIDELAD